MKFISKLKSNLNASSIIRWSALAISFALFVFISIAHSDSVDMFAATQDIFDSRLQTQMSDYSANSDDTQVTNAGNLPDNPQGSTTSDITTAESSLNTDFDNNLTQNESSQSTDSQSVDQQYSNWQSTPSQPSQTEPEATPQNITVPRIVTRNTSSDDSSDNTADDTANNALETSSVDDSNDPLSSPVSLESGVSSSENSGSSSNITPDKIAYLTFDDGPSRKITPNILDILKKEGISATFFVLPKSGVDDLYQRIIDEGHELGNHSSTHNYTKLYKSGDIVDFLDDVLAAHDFIIENFSYEMVSFRFPGGSMGRSASNIDPRRDIILQLGYRWFDWSIDSGDANANVKDKSSSALINIVLNNTRQRDKLIILMHDSGDKQTTLDALPRIIVGLREQGYGFDILMNY